MVNGELKKWTGQTTPVYSTISSTENYEPTLLGSIPFMGEKEALEVLEAASNAYNNGQGLWPTHESGGWHQVYGKICCTNENHSNRSGEIFDVGNREIIGRFRKRIR